MNVDQILLTYLLCTFDSLGLPYCGNLTTNFICKHFFRLRCSLFLAAASMLMKNKHYSDYPELHYTQCLRSSLLWFKLLLTYHSTLKGVVCLSTLLINWALKLFLLYYSQTRTFDLLCSLKLWHIKMKISRWNVIFWYTLAAFDFFIVLPLALGKIKCIPVISSWIIQ